MSSPSDCAAGRLCCNFARMVLGSSIPNCWLLGVVADGFVVLKLLASSSATNVKNTTLLLMRCRQFQIDGFEACLWKMLLLVRIFTADNVKDELHDGGLYPRIKSE